MSDYVPDDMQLAHLNSIDWSAVHEEIMQEPWMDLIDWPEHDGYESALCSGRTAEMETPGIGPPSVEIPPASLSTLEVPEDIPFHHRSLMTPTHATGLVSGPPIPDFGLSLDSTETLKNSEVGRSFICDFKGCKSKSFTRIQDLNRHKKVHDPEKRQFSCPALGCHRVGRDAFYRLDKLKAHILDGHDLETNLRCESTRIGQYGGCGVTLTRDLMAIHASTAEFNSHGKVCEQYRFFRFVRDCPIPKCSFRTKEPDELNSMQAHIRQHSPKSRKSYSERISARGYDAASGDVICHVCPEKPHFSEHQTFYLHFIEHHYTGTNFELLKKHGLLGVWILLSECTCVPPEVRQHRRTLLSLWPEFEYYPVWEDIRVRPSA
ncbi:hypothetical protein CC80DRAFT_539671 [Byssothecium circinans]|uniref:C2H2-type domain-containing protein n=1 Tax=Byssothecium circinans TaxID=147558 RepID=A0A6A5TDQ4_9PLEO|nr:hypothetical protein CC80DRAFT_539671 [Byssothecium circinans]